jgi:hypothetical protein
MSEEEDNSEALDGMDMQQLAKQQVMQNMMEDLDQDDLVKLALVSNDEDTDMAAMLAMLND